MPTIYSIKHLTSFRYTPPVGETLMEVRLQPRSDTQQRCIAFSLDVTPRTSVMIYRDFYGNTVHHFDIPGRHASVRRSRGIHRRNASAPRHRRLSPE